MLEMRLVAFGWEKELCDEPGAMPSVGIEDVRDLISDLDQALRQRRKRVEDAFSGPF